MRHNARGKPKPEGPRRHEVVVKVVGFVGRLEQTQLHAQHLRVGFGGRARRALGAQQRDRLGVREPEQRVSVDEEEHVASLHSQEAWDRGSYS